MSGEEAEDEAPSDIDVPVGDVIEDMVPGMDEAKRSALTSKLLQYAAITDRGLCATDAQRASVEDIVMSLEDVNPTPRPVESELIDGHWTIAYTTGILFKDKPLLKFAVDPVLRVGQAGQKISVDDGKLESIIQVTAFPSLSWTVHTLSRITPVGGERLEVIVEKTRVTADKFANRFDLGGLNFDLPLEKIFSRFENQAKEKYLDTSYLDERLRISRSHNGNLYVFTRIE